MYTGFAEVYDMLMNDVHYGAWADMYARMMTAYGIPRNAKVCECACGTGSLTLPLQQLGYEMMGIDLSQEMLWQAAQKARKAGFGIPFIRQDMRQLRLHRPVDAVLATCDGVNYLLQDVDAAAFFQSAWDAIKPGGGLFFDVSTPYKLEHLLGSQFMGEDRRDVTYMWQNRYFPERQQVEMHLAIFVKEPDGRYRRIDEEQVQRAYQVRSWWRSCSRLALWMCGCLGRMRLRIPRRKSIGGISRRGSRSKGKGFPLRNFLRRWHLCCLIFHVAGGIASAEAKSLHKHAEEVCRRAQLNRAQRKKQILSLK